MTPPLLAGGVALILENAVNTPGGLDGGGLLERSTARGHIATGNSVVALSQEMRDEPQASRGDDRTSRPQKGPAMKVLDASGLAALAFAEADAPSAGRHRHSGDQCRDGSPASRADRGCLPGVRHQPASDAKPLIWTGDRHPPMPLDLIAFDGDDTLWHNERSFLAARERFGALLANAGVGLSDEEVDVHVNRTEIANLQYYGYGVSSFALSLVETAIELTEGRVRGAELLGIIDLAKEMLTEEIELFPCVPETLRAVAAAYPVMLITKGDLLHQTSKLDRSGLRDDFKFVEVVSHKTVETYSRIMTRYHVEPDRFLMIGNTLRSDVLPVVQAGGWAAHIPAAVSWAHEHADMPPETHGRYFEIAAFEQVLEVIDRLARR